MEPFILHIHKKVGARDIYGVSDEKDEEKEKESTELGKGDERERFITMALPLWQRRQHTKRN